MPIRTAAEVVDYGFRVAQGEFGNTEYRGGSDNGGYRSNVGEWWNNAWHWDCLGFVHTMVNGFVGDRSRLGGGAIMDDFVNISDEATTLYKYCSVRGTFPVGNLKQGSLLEMHNVDGHVGLYTGNIDGYHNMVECTGGGVRNSWIDLDTGNCWEDCRRIYFRCRFENWGEFDRVLYEEPKPEPVPTPTPTEKLNPSESDYYYNAIQFCKSEKYMNGEEDGNFYPERNLSREQFAVILWRMDGHPREDYTDVFSDVAEGEWYTDAVMWAYEHDIAKGYQDGSNSFGVGDPITRQDFCVMLYSYNYYAKGKCEGFADLYSYPDVNEISDYASDSVSWAVGNRIMQGRDGKYIAPLEPCTRGECAVMIQRYSE